MVRRGRKERAGEEGTLNSLQTMSLQGEANALHMPVQKAARLPAAWD